MSCFGCFSSSRSDSPPQVVEEKKMRCASLGENVSAKIMDLVGESLGPDKQIVSVAVPAKGCTTVLYRRSDSYLQQDASKLPAKIVRIATPEKRERTDEVETLFVGRPPVPAPVAPPTAPVTKEEGVNQSEEEEQALLAMIASIKSYKDGSAMQSRPWYEDSSDEIVRDEEPADEVIGEGEGDRADTLTVGALKRNEVETFKP